MSNQFLYLDAGFLKAEIAKLIEANPDLADDETLRADMIAGETDVTRIIERALEERQEAKAMAGAIRVREIDLAARRGRFERKSDAMDALIKSVMRAANLPKITLTEATISLTKPSTSVGIEDLEAIPQGFFKLIRQADKTAIKQDLEKGHEVPGAFLVTGDGGIMVRTK